MPYIEVRLSKESISDNQATQLASGITEIMSSTLRKKHSLVAVSIEAIRPQLWFIAERSMREQQQTTAFVSARITQGTNTVEEKALAIEQLFQLLQQVVDIDAEATYIVLDELPATDWGYQGRTQASRKPTIQRDQNGVIDVKHYRQVAMRLRAESLSEMVSFAYNAVRRWCVVKTKRAGIEG